MKKTPRLLVLLILGLLSAVGPFSIDMYLPAFKTIATDFDTSVDHIQLSLSAFFVGVAVGQLIYGPLLDKYGRKKPLLIGLGLYLVASILCALTKDANHLILYRFVQALGSCAGLVASRAMVRDLFKPEEGAKIFSMLMLVIGISPLLAPSVGALVVEHSNWHMIFIILAAIALLIILATIFLLKESYAGNKEMSLKPKAIVGGYWEVLRHPIFLTYCLVGSLASAGLYSYLAGSSYIMQSIYGLTEAQYGTVFAIIASALIIATQLNRIALNRFNSSEIARVANSCQLVVSSILLAGTYFQWINLHILVALIFFYLCCQGFTFPNTSALALSPFSKLAGSASALLGCIQMGLGAFFSAMVSYLHNGTAMPMVSMMALCSFLGLICYQVLPKILKINKD